MDQLSSARLNSDSAQRMVAQGRWGQQGQPERVTYCVLQLVRKRNPCTKSLLLAICTTNGWAQREMCLTCNAPAVQFVKQPNLLTSMIAGALHAGCHLPSALSCTGCNGHDAGLLCIGSLLLWIADPLIKDRRLVGYVIHLSKHKRSWSHILYNLSHACCSSSMRKAHPQALR